ncbi:hypothetical protein FXO37_02039 [Capsicum annuum]|nr:hypothetical protein FXO37_02039 [Capsicum annuum]
MKHIVGTAMYKLVVKLNRLKATVRALNRDRFVEVERKADQAQKNLIDCQKQLQQDPLNPQLINEELEKVKEVQKRNKARFVYPQQKCKCQWLQLEERQILPPDAKIEKKHK